MVRTYDVLVSERGVECDAHLALVDGQSHRAASLGLLLGAHVALEDNVEGLSLIDEERANWLLAFGETPGRQLVQGLLEVTHQADGETDSSRIRLHLAQTHVHDALRETAFEHLGHVEQTVVVDNRSCLDCQESGGRMGMEGALNS